MSYFRARRIVGRAKGATCPPKPPSGEGGCAVARRVPDGGHAAQHLCNIEIASRRLCPTYGSIRSSANVRRLETSRIANGGPPDCTSPAGRRDAALAALHAHERADALSPLR